MKTTQTIIPKGYKSALTLMETEHAIKKLKDYFEHKLSERLELTRVSAPLFVRKETGLNDDLNGIESPVGFDFETDRVEIVHSLAKWKRMALHRYGFDLGKGLYTDMNAIRKDEELDNLHSIYVDQWDWEKVLSKDERSEDYLRDIVSALYDVFKETATYIAKEYPQLQFDLPEELLFVTAQELEDMYPELTPKERENAITKKLKAVFIMGIGAPLFSGQRHDGRAPDYDDWSLNGDIIFWNPVLEQAFELSSMGIRVDEEALLKQLKMADKEDRLAYPFHQMLSKGELPYTVGGGIGQSRICMYFLQKAHIGEVQASIWDQETLSICDQAGVILL